MVTEYLVLRSITLNPEALGSVESSLYESQPLITVVLLQL